MTLRKRLFWLLLLILLLVLPAVAMLGQRLLLAERDNEDHQDLHRLSTLLQHSLERHARYQFSRLEGLALRLALDDRSPATLPGEADALLLLAPPAPAEVLFSRLDEKTLARVLTEPVGQGLSPRVRLEWLEEPLLLLEVPLPDGKGRLLASQRLDARRLFGELVPPTAELHFLAAHEDEETSQPTASTPMIQQRRSPVVSIAKRLQTELHLRTPHSRQGLRLQLSVPRHAYLQSRQDLNRFLAWTLALVAGALLAAWLFLEFGLLRRIRFMHREIASIGLTPQAGRLTRLGDDELGRLGQAVNRMLERLNNSEARDQAILDSIDDGYFEIESGGTVLTVNRGLERQLGFAAGELVGRTLADLLGEEELDRLRQHFRQAVRDRVVPRFVVPIPRRNGSLGYFETSVTLIRDAHGNYQGLRGILHDIGDQVAFQEQLYDLAHRDPLTGLGNRMAFNEQLQQRCEEARRNNRSLALLYMDLDRFKEVNDRYGHATGDALLVAIAERMRASLRQPELLYRLGGDEFTLVLPEADEETALRIAQRLQASLAQPYGLSGQRIDFVLPSIGIALFPLHATSPEALVDAADEAMYQAKLDKLGLCLSHAQPTSC